MARLKPHLSSSKQFSRVRVQHNGESPIGITAQEQAIFIEESNANVEQQSASDMYACYPQTDS